ncbi:hypothetical protein BOTBODRAFT_186495 [Botryobasidium botryosum FD-172 SS1]|uniref:Uncharacterized protein n=1 Tax=Botryobasidium botryosum (strain FD-172 SS1) TaxID=930990 RepID=A0A067MY38_BOTB1|nr:hypothetical protein BOTBODRAFT_186495 [Botryobasidium botryosum FD-172 SS1]
MAAIYDKALKRKDFSGAGVWQDKLKQANSELDGHVKKDVDDNTTPSKSADTGKIVQLMSGDADRIVFLISGAYIIYGAPLEIIIASAFLYQLLGLSAFAGISVLIIITPLNRYFSRRTITIAEELLAARDKRMGLLNELIGAVKFIKFFAWEEKWIKRVQGLRETELKWVLKDRINDVMFSFLWACAPVMVSIIGLLTYTLSGNVLTVSKAFTAVALFSMLRIPLNNLPHWIVRVLEAGVSVTRISDFLGEDEVSDHVSTLNKASTNPGISPEDELIGIDNGSFKWNEPKRAQLNADRTQPAELTNGEPLVEPPAERESSRFELQSISVTFPSRELSVITGPTGSGKTALLLALLGEMTPSTDSTVVHLPKNTTQVDDHGLMNSVSYCAQTTWLEHQSIKENILFRSPYDKARYQQVLECCALNPDLAVFEDGDDTEIGARGVSLSGGQKARVALARAVYARTKHVLLDDVFAAVDSHTARFIFDHLFQGPLMANRTIILVTHHVNLVLPRIHYLIRMGPGGTVDRQGTIQDLRAQGVLEAVVRDFTSDTYASETIVEPQGVVDTSEIEGLTGANAIPKPDTVKPDIKRTKLIQAEVRATGNVKWSIYKTYLEASSWWTWTTFIPILIAIQGCNVAERIWLGVWGDAYDEASSIIAAVTTTARQSPDLTENAYFPSYDVASKMPMPMITNPSSLPSANAHPMFYIGVFSAIVLGAVLLNTTSSLIQSFGSYRASRRLFSRVLATVVQAPMRWFDTTPTGRILNRFSRDIETIDSSLGSSINSTTHYLATFAAGVLTVAVFLPQFLAPALLIGYLYYTLSIGYIRTGRDLRRMESNTHSPIFSAFGELLNGIVTIRAFSAERVFFDEMHSKIDLTTKMWYSLWMLNRYLSLHFDMIGALSVFLTTLFALLSSASPELVGVTITSAMAFTDSVYWACRQTTQLEMDLNSVERVVEYLDIPQEPPNIVESHRPPAYWPSSASLNPLVQVEDLEIRYAPELDPVLKGVSFTLKARERIGLLGRTGSGKSTLAMALLRFVEPSKGRITIDGVDVTTIGLQDLRSRLTIIPQDAVLFSGTIRDNLDPFQEHDDGTLRDALLRVQLVSDNTHQSGDRSSQASSARDNTDDRGISQGFGTVMGSEEQTTLITLNTRVSASGANFSHGQRQLVALARALLRQSTVIIMDEATSSIDFNTDATIQKTIREQFGNSLLITIAHRIRTVVDYDRLIIMDKGTIVEFDTPSNLIAKEGGLFREMCMKSGAFGELAEAIASASVGSPTALHK